MNLITKADDERLVKESEYRTLGTEHPAPHWLLVDSIRAVIAERDALLQEIQTLRADLATANTQLAEKDAEAKRLREAVEWALSYKHNCIAYPDEWFAELRRRASGEGRKG